MREQLERHSNEVEQIRSGSITTADNALQSLANRIADWGPGKPTHGSLCRLGPAFPTGSPIWSPSPASPLERLTSAQPGADEDFAPALQSIQDIADTSVAAHAAIVAAGLNVLNETDLESPERLSTLAVDGDPVAAAISRFYHGASPIGDQLQRLSENCGSCESPLSLPGRMIPPKSVRTTWPMRPTACWPTSSPLTKQVLLAHAERPLRYFCPQCAPRTDDAAVRQSMSDDLSARSMTSLTQIEEAVRTWNNRRGRRQPRGPGAGTFLPFPPCWNGCSPTATT